jgi:hypothetical protein
MEKILVSRTSKARVEKPIRKTALNIMGDQGEGFFSA